jgi:DNA-binding NtrC family response regulator
MRPSILVVDDERTIGLAIERLLGARGYDVVSVQSGDEAIERLRRAPAHVVITDLSLGQMSGMDLLRWVRQQAPETAVVMITAYGSEKIAVEAMKLGAADYVPKPFDNDELELVVGRVLEGMTLRRDLRLFQEQAAGAYRLENLIGRSAVMQRVFDVIRKVAPTDLTVLIRGPSGTGKELVANALHYNSPRRGRPLIKVNCAAFSRELVESELFGHERGAFTGAINAREGKFEIADGGTLLLDEVGDMPLETQAKILRVLQERELERVGGNRTIKVDVRVLAATNQDLETKVQTGSFREDLFYRLNVVPIAITPLRERREDLPLLIEHCLAAAAARLGRPARALAPDVYRRLLDYDWPGNVRELEHALEQALVLASDSAIRLDDLPAALRAAAPRGDATIAAPPSGADAGAGFKESKLRVIEQFERRFIEDALARHHGNITKAAEEMGMYRQHLQIKLAEYDIDAASFRK